MCSNFSLDCYYEYTEATEPPTEAPATEPVTEPTTVPTEAPAEPTTVPTEEPTLPAEAPTQEVELPTEAPTEEATEAPGIVEELLEDEGTSRTLMYIMLGIAGLTGLLILALLIRGLTHKGGRYSD